MENAEGYIPSKTIATGLYVIYTAQENLTPVQCLQNHAARLILGNFDYINLHGMEWV